MLMGEELDGGGEVSRLSRCFANALPRSVWPMVTSAAAEIFDSGVSAQLTNVRRQCLPSSTDAFC